MRTAWLVAGTIVLGSSAHADVLRATRSQAMSEISHTVDIEVENGVATYTVRRMFKNPGKIADQVELEIGLPYGAAATGLRIRATDRWYDGVLMERDAAAALYQEMTGFGAHAAKDPALLAWMWADKLALQIFPVFPGRVSTVEYTLTAPTRYEHGHYVVSYPRVAPSEGEPETAADRASEGAGRDLPLVAPVITVHPSWQDPHLVIMVDGKRAAPGAPVTLVAPKREPWAEIVDPDASYVSSTLTVPASSHTTVVFKKATVDLSLAHTYKSDLRVELITPGGDRVMIHDRKGGGDNNVRGSFPLDLPAGTTGAGLWRMVVSDHAALDTGTLDHWSLTLGDDKRQTTTATDTPVFIPDAPESASDAGVATITITPPATRTWTARLGRVVASKEHAFSRLEVDVAAQLVPTPRHAQIVFVVDSSYSQGAAGVAAQLDVLRAYLSHLPDAEVEIVTYRRRAQRAFGEFIPAKQLDQMLARHGAAFALGNGSALDEGARLAAAALANRRGPRRVVIATDELLRSSLAPVDSLAALAALSPDTVVHVFVPRLDGDDVTTLERNDLAVLAPLATKHHGIYVALGGLPAATIKQLAPTVLELVRPTRIEKLTATGFTLDSDVLHEGDGLRLMLDTKDAPTTSRLAGTMWSDPVTLDATATAGFSQATAAFVFGADEHQALSEAEMMKVALIGRAVSPVTSYVAAEPGTRPSTIGIDYGTLGAGRYGTIGHGSGSGSGGYRERPELESLIDTSPCVAKVHPTQPWKVTLVVETTKDEIVDITPSGSPAMASCLVETVWSVRLDHRFDAEREQFTVGLLGPADPATP